MSQKNVYLQYIYSKMNPYSKMIENETLHVKKTFKKHTKKKYGTDLRCKLIGGLCFPEQWECRDDNSKSEANLPRLGYDQHWLRKAHYPVASSHYLNFNPPTLMIKS